MHSNAELHSNADLAAALHRVADLLIERRASEPESNAALDLLRDVEAKLAAGIPIPVDERDASFVKQMAANRNVDDGEQFESFAHSPYSGSQNALSPKSVECRRVGNTVVAKVVLGTALEGRPGRAHGGATAALFDDVMGAIQPVIGKNGYTRTLSVDYLAPMPTNSEVVMTARQTSSTDRTFTIEADAVVDGRTVATSRAVFVAVSVNTFR